MRLHLSTPSWGTDPSQHPWASWQRRDGDEDSGEGTAGRTISTRRRLLQHGARVNLEAAELLSQQKEEIYCKLNLGASQAALGSGTRGPPCTHWPR